MIDRFVTRLRKIGIEVELHANIPWVYLYKVNGVRVTERFHANHGFTAFFMPVRKGQSIRFSDRRRVFQKIRETIKD